jgi:hypothetical protein
VVLHPVQSEVTPTKQADKTSVVRKLIELWADDVSDEEGYNSASNDSSPLPLQLQRKLGFENQKFLDDSAISLSTSFARDNVDFVDTYSDLLPSNSKDDYTLISSPEIKARLQNMSPEDFVIQLNSMGYQGTMSVLPFKDPEGAKAMVITDPDRLIQEYEALDTTRAIGNGPENKFLAAFRRELLKSPGYVSVI